MTRRARPLAGLLGVLALLLAARAEGVVTASPIAAGCYALPRGCRVHVDPFTLQPASGWHLRSFQVVLGRAQVYDLHTDQDNPPSAAYTPTMPKLGFAARCETSYSAKVVAMDSGDLIPATVGQTEPFTCPTAVPESDAAPLGAIAALALLARGARANRGFASACTRLHRRWLSGRGHVKRMGGSGSLVSAGPR